MIPVDEQISMASASLIMIGSMACMALLFGIIIGLGFSFTTSLDTSDSETKGFILLMIGLFGFLIAMGIAVIKTERKRSALLREHQNF